MKRIKQIKATPCKAKELQPGDLWSPNEQEYWDYVVRGELDQTAELSVRLHAPISKHSKDSEVFRIEIITEEI